MLSAFAGMDAAYAARADSRNGGLPNGSFGYVMRIIMRHDSNAAAMLSVLKRRLRADGWTAPRLARECGVGEATIKRWLAGKGLTIDRLEVLAALSGLSLGDLAREAEESTDDLAHELTLAQEKALSADIFLSFLFMALVNGNTPEEIETDFAVPPRAMEAALARLERLALIDRLRGGRVRPLVDRNLVFRKMPLRTLFERQMKRVFFELDYSSPETIYFSEVVKLSRAGAAQLAELMQRHNAEVRDLADHDRKTAVLDRDWHGTMMVMRKLDMSEVRLAARGAAAE